MTNPLSQYFRRPALYLKLPSGGVGYPAGSIDMPENGELPVYPMTAIDEITSRTPDSLYNGLAVVDLVRSCVPNIKDPWVMLSTDLDPILVAIKIATEGETMEIGTGCPSCSEESKFDVNLNYILSGFVPGDYSQLLQVNDLRIKFCPLNYRQTNQGGVEQFELQKAFNALSDSQDGADSTEKASAIMAKLSEMSLTLVSNTIEYIKTPTDTVFEKDFIREFLVNCDKKTHDLIRDTSINIRKSSEIKPLDITCPHCQHEYKQSLNINVSSFFG